MSLIIVVSIMFLVLFGYGLLLRRDFTMASLALIAGSILALYWTDDLSPYVMRAGIELVNPPLESVLYVALTMLPAILVLLRSERVHSSLYRVSSAFCFAVLGVLLTIRALSSVVVLDSLGEQLLTTVLDSQKVILTCIVVALLMIYVFGRRSEKRR